MEYLIFRAFKTAENGGGYTLFLITKQAKSGQQPVDRQAVFMLT
jgi:hypothetical protein